MEHLIEEERSGEEGSGDEGSGEAPPSEYIVRPHLVSILGHYIDLVEYQESMVAYGWGRLSEEKKQAEEVRMDLVEEGGGSKV